MIHVSCVILALLFFCVYVMLSAKVYLSIDLILTIKNLVRKSKHAAEPWLILRGDTKMTENMQQNVSGPVLWLIDFIIRRKHKEKIKSINIYAKSTNE